MDKPVHVQRGTVSRDLPGRNSGSLSRSQECGDSSAWIPPPPKRSRIDDNDSSYSHEAELSYEIPFEPGPSMVGDEPSEDFDTWEATVTTPEAMRIRRELKSEMYGMLAIHSFEEGSRVDPFLW